MTEDQCTIVSNALHASATWLQRKQYHPASVAVINVAPRAAVGVWFRGAANVAMLSGIDDVSAELCEAIAPAVSQAIEALPDETLADLARALRSGWRLQALVAPLTDEIAIRVLHGGIENTLATLNVERASH